MPTPKAFINERYYPLDPDGRAFSDSATMQEQLDLPDGHIASIRTFIGWNLRWWCYVLPAGHPDIPMAAYRNGDPDVMWIDDNYAAVRPAAVQRARRRHGVAGGTVIKLKGRRK